MLLLVIACKEENNPKSKIEKAVEKVKGVKQNVETVNTITKGFQGMQKNIENLSEMTPVTKETLKEWMPKDVLDMKRTKYEIGKQMGFAVVSNVSLDYKTEDKSKSISLKIIDGAGKGATIVAMKKLELEMDVDSESETGYERTQTFGKQKILVKYYNSVYANHSFFKYIINDRVYVEARGKSLNPDELWNYLKKLEIEEIIN